MLLCIKEKRKAAGISQATLASALAVNQTAVSQWERGITIPGCDRLPAMAKLLNCSIDSLFLTDDSQMGTN